MSNTVLFLRPTSRTYQRDLAFAQKVYQGTVPRQAADELGMTQEIARKVQQALRKRALLWADREISDAMILRLMFDRERAEAEWKDFVHKQESDAPNVGIKRAT